MDFLRRIFGGGSGQTSDGSGRYFYVRPRGCEEIVRVRIDLRNDLSQTDDGTAYWVHKYARGTARFQQVELDLYFDANCNLTNSEIQGGALVTADDYQAWVEKQG